MGNIVDLSKFQKSSNIDWSTFSKNVDLLICRVQYGSTQPDKEYNNHISNAKKYNIPYNTYTFPAFVSVNDARVEARDCYSRSDKDSEIIWLDIESEYDANRNPVGITKLPQDVRLNGIKAYVDELRKQGAKKVGGYIAHNVYEAWGINTIINIFDCVWIPRYGATPKYPCDLHQFTSTGSVTGYSGNLDLSVLNGSKELDYFTGTTQSAPTPEPNVETLAPQFCTKQTILQTLRCDGHTDIRVAPNHASAYVRDTQPGEVFHVFDKVTDANGHCWNNLGGANWVDEASGVFYWLDNPALTSKVHIVQKGETLSKIASSNGTTVSKLCVLNGISNPDKISIGQKIKLN